jgi:predicted ATP-grasp superfamily ATP-dependent carboligase
MRTARGQRRVLVTDAGRGSAISIIRSLGRRGWHVVAADADPQSPGFYSRYTAGRVVYPPPERDSRAAVARLRRAAREHGIDLLIPVTDEVLLPLSEAREDFAGICVLALPEVDALAVTEDKAATLQLAARLGVPTPRSCLVRTADEALASAADLGLPLVVKPAASRLRRTDGTIESFTVTYADTRERLAAAVAALEGRCAVLLQEYCPGEGHGVELLLDRGRPVAAFQHRRLREVPLTGGASACRESVALDPVLFDYAVRILADLRWTGLAMVEFKVGPAGPRLMEVNPRIWGSLPLAVRCGVDFPAGLAAVALDGSAAVRSSLIPSHYPVGVRLHNLDLEAAWILLVLAGRRRYPFLPSPPRRAAIDATLELIRPGVAFDVQTLSDPGPGLADIARIARRLGRKAISVS